MTQLNEMRKLAVPVAEAFAYVADFANVAEWDPGIAESTRAGNGELGLGAVFDVVVVFGSRRTPMKYVITHFEPPHRVVLKGTGTALTAIDDIRFSPIAGGTEVVYTADLQFKGLMKLAAPFLGGTLRKVGEKALDGLAARLGEIP